MTFDKLADRCLLFVDERKQMLVELLKEAELEMTRKCNMYEDTRTYTCNGSDSYGLPQNYKQIINAMHDGVTLKPASESDIYYDDDNEVQDGTPTAYYIRNNALHTDTKSASGKVKLVYYGTVDNIQDASSTPSPVIPEIYHRDLCNYAIWVATAKGNPNLSDKYFALWNNSLEEIINEDADRELIHTIRREV